MRLNEVDDSILNELGVFKSIAQGVKGAVSGYKASQAQRQGEKHSDAIIANLKKDFMQSVGGGQQATYKNLINYLKSHGLSELETIPDPGQGNPETPAQNQTTPSAMGSMADQLTKQSTTSSTGGTITKTPTGLVHTKAPTAESLVYEDAVLNNAQIDAIIQQAVQKNYSRIRAAQQGRTATQPTAGASTSSQANTTGVVDKVTVGQINKALATLRKRDLLSVQKTLNAILAQKGVAEDDADFIKPARMMQGSPEAIKKANNIIQKQADQNIISQAKIAGSIPNQSTLESTVRFNSKFLGKDI